MNLATLRVSCLLPLLVLAACDSGGRNGGPVDPAPASRLLVTTNTTVLDPAPTPAPSVDLERFGIVRVEANYRLTTPADEPFAFDLVSWRPGAAGLAKVAIAHVGDGGQTPVDANSLGAAGILPQSAGLKGNDGWLEASGDGFARLSLQGKITANQVLAVVTEDAATLVAIEIGPRSEINRPDSGGESGAGVVSRRTIYSSASPMFGLPTVAVSGDRTSIVCYEGAGAAESLQRYELRLQHDAATNVVTGGGSVETSADTGGWRDHEIAALYNVLAVARSEADGVTLRLSFDRGASFAQSVTLPVAPTQSRLVQIAMAADYTLAVAFWSSAPDGSGLRLMLAEGGPIAFDATGSPTWFQFGAAQVVHTMPQDSSPLTTGIAWSAGGDLVVGYGASWFEPTVGWAWKSTTEFRCAIRRYGEALVDRLVDVQEIMGMDPTVAVLGQGSTLRIFYAYEVRDGIRLAVSENGGASFSLSPAWGQTGDHLPSVFARTVGGRTRVDVLFLAPRAEGIELHRSRWLDWPSQPREDEELTTARLTPLPASGIPGQSPYGGMRSTQVSWLGYDAVRDGDELVVAYDEVTTENVWWIGPVFSGGGVMMPGTATTTAGFVAAPPPPLAPGMTEAVRPVNPDEGHQLVLLRLR